MADQSDTSRPVLPRHVLVVGAYGLIGAGIVRALRARGHRVTGLGRDASTAARVLPEIEWIIRDLRQMTGVDVWSGLLDGVDAVVNAAGALQDGGRDDLRAVQVDAVAALAAACAETGTALIQISAAGARPEASTPFLTTKAEADAAVAASGARFWVFRPGLVLAQNAYGGTALMRLLAAMPVIQPVAMADAPIQTVGLIDVADAVGMAVEGRVPDGLICDLVEPVPQTLGALIGLTRNWLGLGRARIVAMTGWTVGLVSRGADLLGRLGWRSPLRSTAVRVLADGISGDPEPWRQASGHGVADAAQTFASMTATAEHRLAARMALLFPLIVAVLSLFWLISGVMGFFGTGQAASVLTAVGWPETLAVTSVLFWSIVDIVLGITVLVRRYARAACLGMIGVSLFYLAAATVVTPGLWLDPLGPLVKVLPSIMLAAVAWMLLEER